MTFEEFAEEIVTGMKEQFRTLEIRQEYVEKLQGQSYHGLILQEPGAEAGVSIDLDRYYRETENGLSTEKAMEKLCGDILHMDLRPPVIDMESLRDYEKMKCGLMLQIVPVKGNEEMLSRAPFRRILDMAVVYRFLVDEGGMEGSILLTEENIRALGIPAQKLDADAVSVCRDRHPVSVRTMASVLFGTGEEECGIPDLWVIGNDTGRYGASVIAYPDTLEKVSERLGGGYYLIPSSIHEMLAVRDRGEIRAADLDRMIVNVNETEVAPEDRLTDHCYHYDPERRLLESGTEYEKRRSIPLPV